MSSFSALRHLTIPYFDNLPILSTPHLQLTTLTIGNAPGDDEEDFQKSEDEKYGDWNGSLTMLPLLRKVRAVAGLLLQHPKRFPSLRFVGILDRDDWLSFVTKRERQRNREALKEMAEVLKGIGLSLVDKNGLERRDEWNDE